MRRFTLALVLASCGLPGGWEQRVVEPPLQAAEIVDAVAALPECDALCRGGIIRWRAHLVGDSCVPETSCAFPNETPYRVDVVMVGNAWRGTNGTPQFPDGVSALAHALCHICGYTDGPDREAQADACAMRAKARGGIGCSISEPASRRWTQLTGELPDHANEVVSAVGALPECGSVRRGGVIHWRGDFYCGSPPVQAMGCAFPDELPQRIEVVMSADAWNGAPQHPEISTLAHELCHICGYTKGPDRGEAAADACAMRARNLAGR